MLFGLVSKSLLVLVVYFAAPSGAVDQDTTVQLGSYLHKPFGPFYCKARCVALCLENKLAPNVSACVERFCSNFDENTPCSHYDTSCWLNCGRRLEGDYSVPVPVQGIEAKFDQVDGNQDPYTVHITWEPQDGVHMYILEIFPVKSAFGLNEDKVVQLLTASNFYMFHKPDLCGVYMARVMAVTGFGWSTPRYKRLNGWTQPLSNVDLHLKIRSMMRSPGDPFPIKVFLEYKKPSTWEEGDAIIADSNVRAFDCNKPIQHDSGFGDTEPDIKGFLWPMVFINDSKSEIELSFPEDVLYPQCKFVYKILALKTRCGMTTTFDDQEKMNEVPFSMNCQNVQNAQCHANQPSRPQPEFKRIVEPAQPKDDLNRDLLRPFIFGKPAKIIKEPADTTPPSPWSAPVVNNDTLWLLFESFLRGFSQGANENQAKGRKRVMPEAPADTTTEAPLPPAPIFTSESGPDAEDKEFMMLSWNRSMVWTIQ